MFLICPEYGLKRFIVLPGSKVRETYIDNFVIPIAVVVEQDFLGES